MSEIGEYETPPIDEIKEKDRSFDRDETPLFFEAIKKDEEKDAKLIQIYQELDQNPETEHLAATYSEILVEADRCIDVVANILSELKNTQLIPAVAQSNMRAQAEEYLKAASGIITDGSSTISVFGEYMTFYDLRDIERHMEQMLTEFSEIGIDTDSFNEFIDKDFPVLDKYLFVQEQENSESQVVRVIQHVDSDEDRFDFLKNSSFINSDSVETSFSWSLFGKEGNLSDMTFESESSVEYLAKEYGLSSEFHSCRVMNPERFNTPSLETSDDVLRMIEENDIRIVLYFQPSIPFTENDNNRQIIINTLKELKVSDSEGWERAISYIVTNWLKIHRLKEKHFNSTKNRRDRQLLYKVVDNSSQVMSRRFVETLIDPK